MNKSFNFQKTPLVLATAFCALSINAIAETYTVQVELNSTIDEIPLVATETQAMTYPVLEVNQATKEGSKCVADSRAEAEGFDGQPATNVNSLCPGATALHSKIQFKGVPSVAISIERTLLVQEQHGVKFAHSDGKAFQHVYNTILSADEGIFNLGLWSSVTLMDKSQVTDAVMEFTYGISAAYQ